MTREYRRQGWWQDGPPTHSDFTTFRDYRQSAIAMGAPRCEHYSINGQDPPGWAEARERCRLRGYRGIHLYISTFRDHNDAGVDMMRERDPFGAYGRVRVLKVNSPTELKQELARMLMRCEVVDFSFFASHGNQGLVSFQDGSRRTIGHLLSSTMEPCILSPHAQMQFTGCNIACRPASELVGEEIHDALFESYFIPPHNPLPFQNVKFLFNTDLGYVVDGYGQLDWLERNVVNFRTMSVESANGVGLEYSVHGGDKIRTDIPPDQIPACHE